MINIFFIDFSLVGFTDIGKVFVLNVNSPEDRGGSGYRKLHKSTGAPIQIPRFFQTTSKTKQMTVLEILSNYFKNQTQTVSEILSNYFKNQTKVLRDSFKLVQKQDKTT